MVTKAIKTNWYINEEGNVYAYGTVETQKEKYPDDLHISFDSEADAQWVADVLDSYKEMIELAGHSLDILTGDHAVSAEKVIAHGKALLDHRRINMVVPTTELLGKIARVRLSDERLYVAEVRGDFGQPHWSGSWHGFGLNKGVAVDVVEWLT